MQRYDDDSSPKEVVRPPTPDQRTNSPLKEKQRKSSPSRVLLSDTRIIGPSGSGKSSLINLLSNEGFQVASEGMGLCTTKFWSLSNSIMISDRAFRLIDSPGFNTSTLSNPDILKQLVAYLAKARSKYNIKISGVLYLHPQDDDLSREQLKQNLEALTHLFGEPWLSCFTFAIVGNNTPVESDVVRRLQDPSSPFYPLHVAGARFRCLPFEVPAIQDVLLEFDPTPASEARFYSRVRWFPSGRISGLESVMEEILGSQQAASLKKSSRAPKVTLEESETTRQQLQVTLDEAENELKSLRSQLDQTQQEYASLRSELQLNDNTEQSKIVQSLQDLSRAIDNFGRSVAEHMVDNFASSFKKDDPTTLDASDFAELQRQFGHQEGKSSLAASTTGEGLPIEDLIDLALRNFLCQKLYKDVFVPFHPTLTTSAEPGFMASLYEEVRSQSTPIAAAKWRASSFMALSKGKKLNKPLIEEQVENLASGDIQKMLDNLFGQANPVTLTVNQRNQLQDVITQAWELNYVLKGEVVTLGDFQPLYYEREVPFDPKTMVEFEASKKRKTGDVAICTITLGLTLSHSKGTGKDVPPLVVCPAKVVTPTLYTVLGAQGCGKSSFINAALSESARETSNGYELTTKELHISGLQAGKHKFMLVDSPGFDNSSMSDGEILAKLIRFLCGKTPAKVAGVIYLHTPGTHLGSGILRRNLSLIKTLLGDSFLNRLTILLVPRPGEQADHKELVSPLLDPKSPFYSLYDSGAQIDVSALETESIRKILLSYVGKPPVLTNVQNELCRSGRVPDDTDISSYVTRCIRAKEGAPVVAKLKATIVGLTTSQVRQPSSTQRSSDEVKKLQLELTESKKQTEDFSTQLQQHLTQYAALCSQLQIHENLEQSEIIQNLIDLNRRVEDFALSLSQHLVDTYGHRMTTTRQAFELSELKRLFEHEEGKASLVQSSAGVGMPLEDFLDVAIRSILCEQIYKRVFAPFHPGIVSSDPRNGYTFALYGRIREQGSQATLGRWRTATFAAISQMIGDSELSLIKSKIGVEILNDNLAPMLRYLFGPKKKAQLKDSHVKALSELLIQAWDWCVILKGKIVLLGDFQLTAYRYGQAFDVTSMSEFEPRRGGTPPGRILSTIGLGLNVFHAQSSGGAPGRVTLSKASVVTEGWFERP